MHLGDEIIDCSLRFSNQPSRLLNSCKTTGFEAPDAVFFKSKPGLRGDLFALPPSFGQISGRGKPLLCLICTNHRSERTKFVVSFVTLDGLH